MIAVERSRELEDVLPIVSLDLHARMAPEQRELERARVVHVDRDVEQILTGPPQHHRGGKRAEVRFPEKRNEADERDEHLVQAAAERRHEVAERREDEMAGLVKRNADRVQERRAYDVLPHRPEEKE